MKISPEVRAKALTAATRAVRGEDAKFSVRFKLVAAALDVVENGLTDEINACEKVAYSRGRNDQVALHLSDNRALVEESDLLRELKREVERDYEWAKTERDELRAEVEKIREAIMETGISDHEGGFGDTYYARPASHMLEELLSYYEANAQRLEYAVELLAEKLHARECSCDGTGWPTSYCPVIVQARKDVADEVGNNVSFN